MMNEPTNSEISANASSAWLRPFTAALMVRSFSATIAFPVTTSAPGRRHGEAVAQLLLGHPVVGNHADVVEPARLGHQVLGRGLGEQDPVPRGDAVGGAELDDADDPQPLRAHVHEHGGGIANGEVALIGGGLVDDDLVIGPRRPPLDQGERIESSATWFQLRP